MELSSTPVFPTTPAGFLRSRHSASSDDSQCPLSATTVSSNESMYAYIGDMKEGDLSVQVLGMTLDDGRKEESLDSVLMHAKRSNFFWPIFRILFGLC